MKDNRLRLLKCVFLTKLLCRVSLAESFHDDNECITFSAMAYILLNRLH